MATHFSVLAWRIPGMGEAGGLPSMGSHSVRHDWSDLAAYHFSRFHIDVLIYGIFLFLTYFTLYERVKQGPCTSLQMAQFHSFLWLSNIPVCVCVCVPHLLYPFLYWWTFSLPPCPGYCKQHWLSSLTYIDTIQGIWVGTGIQGVDYCWKNHKVRSSQTSIWAHWSEILRFVL